MSARPGLCGGHRATGVPTAITNLRVMHNSDSDSESNYRSKREPQIIVSAIVEIDVVANFKS